jgi:hypothetical protein
VRIAFDFDGVFTDLSQVRCAGLATHDYLYSPVSIALAEPRYGIGQLLSLFAFLADIVVLSSRPGEDRGYIDAWLQRYRLRALVSEILCCGGARKTTLMKDHGIEVLVDDELREATWANSEFVGILWQSDDWLPVAQDVLSYLVSSQRATIRPLGRTLLSEARLVSDWGASEVFLLRGADGNTVKVRVCEEERDRDRMVSFLRLTEACGYSHVARLAAVSGTAVLKSFLVGSGIAAWDTARRLPYLAKTGAALAALHALPCCTSISPASLRLDDEPECLLVCSADEHNLIATPAGDVAFVDLGACTSGSRWVDLCWANALLCRNAGELAVLAEAYLVASGGIRASEREMASAKRCYQLWLTTQLLKGLNRHSGDLIKREVMNRTLRELWKN